MYSSKSCSCTKCHQYVCELHMKRKNVIRQNPTQLSSVCPEMSVTYCRSHVAVEWPGTCCVVKAAWICTGKWSVFTIMMDCHLQNSVRVFFCMVKKTVSQTTWSHKRRQNVHWKSKNTQWMNDWMEFILRFKNCRQMPAKSTTCSLELNVVTNNWNKNDKQERVDHII